MLVVAQSQYEFIITNCSLRVIYFLMIQLFNYYEYLVIIVLLF